MEPARGLDEGSRGAARGPATVCAAFEASVPSGSVALRAGHLTRVRRLDEGALHARDLLPALGEILAELELGPADLQGLVVGTGPGSYTGLRVAIATAQGLARATGAVLVGVPSIEALASAALESGATAHVCLDAHGGAFYCARYRRGEQGAQVEVLEPPRLVPVPELARALPAGQRVLTLDDERAHAKLPPELGARVEAVAAPSAEVVLELGLVRLALRGPDDPAQVEPLYLRPFEARARRR